MVDHGGAAVYIVGLSNRGIAVCLLMRSCLSGDRFVIFTGRYAMANLRYVCVSS